MSLRPRVILASGAYGEAPNGTILTMGGADVRDSAGDLVYRLDPSGAFDLVEQNAGLPGVGPAGACRVRYSVASFLEASLNGGAYIPFFPGGLPPAPSDAAYLADVSADVPGLSAEVRTRALAATLDFASTTVLPFGVSRDDASTNTVIDVLRLRRSSSGVVGAGIGGGLLFQAEDSAGTFEDAARIAGVLETVTDAAEVGALVFYTRPMAGLAARWRMNGPGHLLTETDNTFDIGAAGATRPRTVYAGTSVVTPAATVSGLTPNAFMYPGAGGALTSTAAATDGQLLIGRTGLAPLAAALTGTANRVTVIDGAGTITLSGPQDIHTAAIPTFAGMLLGTGTVPGAGVLRLEQNDADTQVTFFDTGDTGWSLGQDFSAARRFSLSRGTVLGTTEVLSVSVTNQWITTASTWNLNATGLVQIDSTGGAINIGAGADAFAIDLGTGAAARTITIGNISGTTAVIVRAGTGASSWTMTGAGTFDLVAGTGTINLATNATDHSTLIGSVTGTSAYTQRSGTGAMTFTAGGAWDANVVGAATLDADTVALTATRTSGGIMWTGRTGNGAATVAGGDFSWVSGTGGASDGVGAGGRGGAWNYQGSAGGAASGAGGLAGTGGDVNNVAGQGGAASAAQAGGAGANAI